MNPENRPAVPLEKQPVRASDTDRDRIADILREALAEGRLDADEHSERVEAVYRAKTLAELDAQIRDLPAGQRGQTSSARSVAPRSQADLAHASRDADVAQESKNVVAVLSGTTRKGRWRVGGRISAVAVCGGVDLDLTEAIFEQQYTVIHATAVCGGIEIKVPENVTLRSAGSGVMGGFDVGEGESTDPNAPVVMIQGVAVLGGVDAKRVRGKRVRDLSGE